MWRPFQTFARWLPFELWTGLVGALHVGNLLRAGASAPAWWLPWAVGLGCAWLGNVGVNWFFSGRLRVHPRHCVLLSSAHAAFLFEADHLEEASAWCRDNCRGPWVAAPRFNAVFITLRRDMALFLLFWPHRVFSPRRRAPPLHG